MALEDKILQILGRGAITWDGLRAELGVSPGELDASIRNLEGAHQIARDRGRFHLNGAPQATQPTATAQASAEDDPVKKKPCNDCGVPKLLDDFPVNTACKDGHSGQCKECISKKSKVRRLAKQGGSAAAAAKTPVPPSAAPPIKSAPVVLAPKASFIPPVMVLHFQDGVRVGPVSVSSAGVAQMPYHVDISADQLDELVTWWLASKKAAA